MAGLCESCGECEWRYKCPGCGRRSCSVVCVKRHKTELGCSGKRRKTGFVSLSNFTTSQLLSDYHFLEEVGQVVDSSHRSWQAVTRSQRDARHKRQNLLRLQSVAGRRGTRVCLLPQGMGRHKHNTSRTVWREETRQLAIEWQVKLVFPDAGLEYVEERVPEERLLREVLHKYIHPHLSDPIIRHRLRCYVSEGEEEVRERVAVFVKLERTEEHPSSHRFAQLDLAAAIRDNLRDKTVVEFPELHVVMTSSPAITDYTQQRREEEGEEGEEGGEGEGETLTKERKQEDEPLNNACTPTSLQLLATAYSSTDSDVES